MPADIYYNSIKVAAREDEYNLIERLSVSTYPCQDFNSDQLNRRIT